MTAGALHWPSVVTRRVRSRWQVEARVAVEKAVGHQLKPCRHYGLDGKIFGAHRMVQTKHVPSNHVCISRSTALFRPRSQSVAAVRMVHKVTGGETLARIVGCYPQLLVDKGHSFATGTVGVHKRANAAHRLQLERRRLAHVVCLFAAGEFPVPFRVRVPLAAAFSGNGGLLDVESVSMGIRLGIVRFLNCVALLDDVLVTVNAQVKAGAKVVLMNLTKDSWHDFAAVLAALKGFTGDGVDDSGGLHLKLDGSVQVKVPVATCDGREQAIELNVSGGLSRRGHRERVNMKKTKSEPTILVITDGRNE